jgi:hypothetical protein
MYPVTLLPDELIALRSVDDLGGVYAVADGVLSFAVLAALCGPAKKQRSR